MTEDSAMHIEIGIMKTLGASIIDSPTGPFLFILVVGKASAWVVAFVSIYLIYGFAVATSEILTKQV